ncbi:hypothetical protein EE66_05625 [Helicobacter pylori]|nr:hypothetical protein EE66_05625 [Helicobacter pylori]
MQTLKNKAFRVSIQWNTLVRKLLSLERGGFTIKQNLKKQFFKSERMAKKSQIKTGESLRVKLQTL